MTTTDDTGPAIPTPSDPTDGERRYKRLTINVANDVYDELTRLADEQGITVTDVIKRAVALHRFVWDHRNGELLIREGDEIQQVIIDREPRGRG